MSGGGRALKLPAPNLERLAYLAALVAVETPVKPGGIGTRYANVRYSLIGEIRAELEAAGFDWRMAHGIAAKTLKETAR